MARLITFNGPLGVGKTWTVNKLKDYFGVQGVAFEPVNFQEPLRVMCYYMLDVAQDFPYDLFKITRYYGKTGREWMIHLSETMKEFYPDIWVHKAFDLMSSLDRTTLNSDQKMSRIFYADSQGFEVELDFLFNRCQRDMVDLITISIEPPEKKHLRGKKWQEDDSRYNLAHKCDFVVTDSTDAYYLLRNEIQRRGWA